MAKQLRIGAAVVVVGALLAGLGWGRFVAAKTPTAPPTIDQILGTWSVSVSVPESDLTTGAVESYKGKGTLTITKIDDQTVNLNMSDNQGGGPSNQSAYYMDGTLLMGSSDDDVFGSNASAYYFIITGKPGKLTAKGQWLEYDLNDNYIDVGTASLKQTATH